MMRAAGEETNKAEDNNGQRNAEVQEQQPLDANLEAMNKEDGEPIISELVTPSTGSEPTSVESAPDTQADMKPGEQGQVGN